MLAPRKTLWSTPAEVIEVAISALKITSDDIVFDIGAGDGRFLTTCAKQTGALCTGVEINNDRVEEALQRIKSEGLEDKCTMISGNALEQDYSSATVFYLYLIPRGLRIILPVLKTLGKNLRVATYMAPFPESETPIETFHLTSAKHPGANWPLYLYDISPEERSTITVDDVCKSDTSVHVVDEQVGQATVGGGGEVMSENDEGTSHESEC